jgi:hypothetical protein
MIHDLGGSVNLFKRLIDISCYEIGRLLKEIRDRQKRFRQFYAFLPTMGSARSRHQMLRGHFSPQEVLLEFDRSLFSPLEVHRMGPICGFPKKV